MDRKRREWAAPLIAFLVAGMPLAYILAYFWLATVSMQGPNLVRTYRGQWQADLFTPGAMLESMVRGQTVYVGHI